MLARGDGDRVLYDDDLRRQENRTKIRRRKDNVVAYPRRKKRQHELLPQYEGQPIFWHGKAMNADQRREGGEAISLARVGNEMNVEVILSGEQWQKIAQVCNAATGTSMDGIDQHEITSFAGHHAIAGDARGAA